MKAEQRLMEMSDELYDLQQEYEKVKDDRDSAESYIIYLERLLDENGISHQ